MSSSVLITSANAGAVNITTSVSVQSLATYIDLQAPNTTGTFAQVLATYTDLQATDIKLLSAILDKYFIDSYGLSDAAAIAFAKALPDLFTMDEAATISFAKTLADSQSIAETFTRIVSWVRAFTDSTSLSDAPAIALAKAIADSYSLSDSPALVYAKVLADAFGLDDTVTAKDTAMTKTNVATVSDAPAFAVTKAFGHSISISENFVYTVGRNSRFNNGTFNSFTLNS
tara:strand:- start:892 stop:1578 length:687 start_codon:yes stop_codon:yes gene_type:complete